MHSAFEENEKRREFQLQTPENVHNSQIRIQLECKRPAFAKYIFGSNNTHAFTQAAFERTKFKWPFFDILRDKMSMTHSHPKWHPFQINQHQKSVLESVCGHE